MNKVTDTKCLNGKRHRWTKINEEIKGLPYKVHSKHNGLRWCKQCGSLTQVCFNPMRQNSNQRLKQNREYVIALPKIMIKHNENIEYLSSISMRLGEEIKPDKELGFNVMY